MAESNRWRRGTRVAVAGLIGLTTFGGPVLTTPPAAADGVGLVAAYGFEDGSGTEALDASGSGLTGAVSGASWSATGKTGGALSFDGVNDVVTVPDAAVLDLTTGMTLEAWVRPTTLTGWRTVLLKERSNGLAYGLYASEGSGRPNTYLSIGGTDRELLAPAILPVSTWTHLAATHDGATMRLYVNGAQVASRAMVGAIGTSSNPLGIGGNGPWGEYFAGLIDDVRVYNRALGVAEIQADMITPVGPGEEPPPPADASTIGRWTGPVELGTVAVNMIQLHTGRILMFRGETQGGTSATIYDPITGSRKSVPAPYNIFCSGHSQLADGRILVVGGHDSDNGILGSAEAAIFDPVAETWTSVPSMSQRRWYPSATTLPDGRVLVTSGGKTSFTDIADIPEIYDPATNSWTQLTSARLAFPYYPFSFVLPDGKVVIAGAGENPMPTYMLDVAQQQWTTVDPVVIDGGSAAMFAPGKVIKSGTSATTDVNNVPSASTTYVLDMTQPSPRWRQTAPMARPRAYHTLTPLPDGTVIVTGGGVTTEGKNVSAAVYEAEIWSPTTETWTTMSSMQVPRLYHATALLMPDARVMVSGSGDSYGGPDQTTAEFFEPPYLFKGPRPTLTGAPTNVAHGSTFDTTVTGTIAKVTLERLGAVTHQFDEDARHVDLQFAQTGSQLSITAPANANIAPPGYYMMFAVSDQGVPSVASIVRLPVAEADGSAPSAPASAAATGGLGRVDLSWAASTDNVGVTGYDIHRSSVAGFTPSAANKVGQTSTQTAYADVGLVAGTYYYRVVARDGVGNVSAPSPEATGVALADTAAPAISLTAPTDGSTLSGSVTVTASASDNVGVAGVQFRLDGTNLGAEDTAAPYSSTWNTATASNGNHTITAVARDVAGNQATSSAASITVNNTAPPPPTGLVGAWSFDAGSGTAAVDASDENNDGTVSGAAWATDGRYGGALSFDGVNDRVDVPDDPSLDLTTAMTVEAWVRPSSLSGWRTAVMKEAPGGLAYALYASDGSGPSSWMTIGGNDVDANGAGALTLGAWSHVATTYDGAVMRLFVNGTQVSSRTVTGSMPVTNSSFRIGGNAVWGEWFAGSIDEVRVYNRALTAGEIQTDMTTAIGAGPAPDDVGPSTPEGLTATGAIGRIDLSWSAATDNVAVTGYAVHRASVPGFTPSALNKVGDTATTAYADTGLAPGTYFYCVIARDAASNVSPHSNEASAAATADTTGPTVSVTQPAGGVTVSGTVTAAASATDNVGVVGVQFRVDGVNLAAEDTTAPYQVSWNTTGAANGSHEVVAVARDAAGNITVSTPVTVTVSNTAPPPPTGLVGAWSFDAGAGSAATDASSNSNHGTLVGPTWSTAGRFGGALSFDGVNDRVDIADAPSLDLTTGMTLEAWVRPTTTTGWRTVMMKERAGGLAYALYSSNNQGRPEVDIRLTTDRFSAAPSALPANQWSHLAATYDGSTLRVYVNGVSVASRAYSGAMVTSANPLRIGGNTVWSEWFGGLIDEVRVYNRALTAAQIQADMVTPIT